MLEYQNKVVGDNMIVLVFLSFQACSDFKMYEVMLYLLWQSLRVFCARHALRLLQ